MENVVSDSPASAGLIHRTARLRPARRSNGPRRAFTCPAVARSDLGSFRSPGVDQVATADTFLASRCPRRASAPDEYDGCRRPPPDLAEACCLARMASSCICS